MSKAAVYQGLAQGLQTFGQGLQQQQIENALEKRERSLADLRRRWQKEDRAEDREFQLGLMDRADERWENRYERQRQDTLEDRDYMSPVDQARVGLIDAQEQLYRSRAGEQDQPFDIAKINLSSFTPASVAEARRYVDETGDEAGAMELLEYKSNIDQETQIEQKIRAQALQATNELLSEYPDRTYQQFGIAPETPPQEARRQIFQQQYQFLKETFSGDPMAPDEGQGGGDRPLIDQASEANVDETEGGLAFRAGGMAKGLMDEVSGSPVKAALWGPLPRLYQRLGEGLLGPPIESFRQGFSVQGGGGIDENLLRDVAADLQTMGEEQVREELRRSGEPNPDQVIEAAKAMTDA